MKIVMFFAAAVLSSTLVASLPIDQPKYSTRQAQEEFFRQHGYYDNCIHDNTATSPTSNGSVLDSPEGKEGRLSFEGDYIEAADSGENEEKDRPVDSADLLFWRVVRCFQKKSGLAETGIVNEETRIEMETLSNAPSSDAHNRKKRFATSGKWKKNDLTYYIVNYDVDRSKVNITEEVIKSEIQKAVQLWTEASGLRVTEANSTTADIRIGFYVKDHKDGFPFDGSSGTLAHTFMPQDGDIHLDASEAWSAYTDKGLDLLYVVLHEFGHSIGISHSDDKESVMGPEMRGFDPNRALAKDDVLAVQSLYGLPTVETTSSSPQPSMVEEAGTKKATKPNTTMTTKTA